MATDLTPAPRLNIAKLERLMAHQRLSGPVAIYAHRHLPALIAAVRALRVMFESGHANLIGTDPNTLEHGNLVGFPLDDRDRAKRFCAVLDRARAALDAFDFEETTDGN